MKLPITLSAVLIVFFFAFAKAQSPQTCDCKQELSFINDQLRDMISFKKQIKGETLKQYEQTYQKVIAESSQETTTTECFLKINALRSLIKDKHTTILHTEEILQKDMLQDTQKMEAYRKSNRFINHPISTLDVTTLQENLSTMPYDSLEGIYNLKEEAQIGIIKVADGYQGIVLTSTTPNWLPGQIKYHIRPVGNNMYDVVTSNYAGGNIRFIPAMLQYDGRLWHLKKEAPAEFTHTASDQKDWEFKQLDEHTQYVYFGTFSNRKENVEAFKQFYNTYKDKFTAKNIIVDLRDNSGGNSKYSDPFYKIFKKKNMKVYVITNFFTGSNGEQFTLKLKSLKNATHLGQRTYGALAYGSNYGNTIETPSGLFAIYPTDMNFHKYIDYEYVGVQPDVKLLFTKDWIDQTLEIINSKTP